MPAAGDQQRRGEWGDPSASSELAPHSPRVHPTDVSQRYVAGRLARIMLRRTSRAVWLAAIAAGVTSIAACAQNREVLGAVTGHILCSDTQQPARLAHVVLQPVVDPNSPVLDTSNKDRRSEGVFHLQTVGLDGSFTFQPFRRDVTTLSRSRMDISLRWRSSLVRS